MRKLMTLVAAGVILMGASSAVAATRSEIEARACSQYKYVDTALKRLRSVGPQTTLGQVRADEQQLKTSYDRFAETAEAVAKPQVAKLDDRIRGLYKTVDNLPAEATGDQARAMIQGDIARVQVAKKQLLNTLGCSEGDESAP